MSKQSHKQIGETKQEPKSPITAKNVMPYNKQQQQKFTQKKRY